MLPDRLKQNCPDLDLSSEELRLDGLEAGAGSHFMPGN